MARMKLKHELKIIWEKLDSLYMSEDQALNRLKYLINKNNNGDDLDEKFTYHDMRKAFEAGGDWRMACKNLSDGVSDKQQWANANDFVDFMESNYK